MKKVIIFGAGGKIIKELLDEEVPAEIVLAVEQISEWVDVRSEAEIRLETEEEILPFIGRAAVIVLSDPAVALCSLEYLQRKYPEQEFVGYGWEMFKALKADTTILASKMARRSEKYQDMKAMRPGINLDEPECKRWIDLAVRQEISDEVLRCEILDREGERVLVYAPEFLSVQGRMKDLQDWRKEIVDMKQLLVCDVCTALHLVGKDGLLPRQRI